MPLTSGTRLGSYEIVAPLGAGGMGEVYRARDTKLERLVAIKVLPPHLAENASALVRFEREAKAVAALSHPNILSIFDFGREHETAYAVMELLDGETLRQKLAAPIAVRKAVDYGVQIARGLAAAHEKGIVHRDLKPENVFVTTDGRVKILDFGLARQTLAFAGGDATMSPTIDRQTDPGTVLGTVGYMAPEQARGEPGDHRSDLFSLGAVLYELVTGRRAFQRDTAPETLTAILRDDPADLVTSSTTGVSPGLARLILHCLEKNPSERFQSARDVAFALEALSGTSTSAAHAVVGVAPRHRAWLPWGVAILFAVISAGLVAVNLRRPAGVDALTRLSIQLPKELPYLGGGAPMRSVAISPDGRRIVYVSAPQQLPGRRQLYTRFLDRLSVEPLPGTDGAYQPFFSPDGKWLAFFTGAGELKKLSLDGGPPVTLVRGLLNGQWGFGAWRTDGVIVFSAFENLLQVPAEGGTPKAVTTVDAARNESFHQFPQVVPATGDVLFTMGDKDGGSRLDLVRWDTKERSMVLENTTGVVLTASGHLLFSRDGVLMAAAFDARRRTAGSAVPLPESVVTDNARFGTSQLAVSAAGTLAYLPTNPNAPEPMLGWVNRSGAFAEIGPLPKGAQAAALSPDGNTAAVQTEARVFLFDMIRHVTSPLDLGRRITESVAWHPDGKRLTLGGPYLSLFDIDTGKEARLTESGRPKRFASWSPDGRVVAYMTFNPNQDIHVLTLDQGTKPRPLLATDAIESDPAISPDGRWIAYRSTGAAEGSQRTDVYVARFPEGTGKVQITSGGGGTPFWGRDGRELFFGAPPGVLQVVRVTSGDRLEIGAAQTLFPLADLRVFGIAADGARFLVGRMPRVEPPTDIVVVQNAFQELSKLVPPN